MRTFIMIIAIAFASIAYAEDAQQDKLEKAAVGIVEGKVDAGEEADKALEDYADENKREATLPDESYPDKSK